MCFLSEKCFSLYQRFQKKHPKICGNSVNGKFRPQENRVFTRILHKVKKFLTYGHKEGCLAKSVNLFFQWSQSWDEESTGGGDWKFVYLKLMNHDKSNVG